MKPKKLGKKTFAQIRADLIEARARELLEASPLPPRPYLTDGVLTDNGLKVIAIRCHEGDEPDTLAAILGLSAVEFGAMLGTERSLHISPARIAWRLGVANQKSELTGLTLLGARAGGKEQQQYLLKAYHAMKDTGPAVVVNSQHNIHIVPVPPVPGEMDDAARQINEQGGFALPVGPVSDEGMPVTDSRATSLIIKSYSDIGKPAAEIDAYLKSIGRSRMRPDESGTMVDVSPDRPKQIAAPTPEPAPQRQRLTPENGQPQSPTFNKTTSY